MALDLPQTSRCQAAPQAVERRAHAWAGRIPLYQCPRAPWRHVRITTVVESPGAAARLRPGAAQRLQQGEAATAPSARRQALPEAGARHERTLEAVSCTPWLGTRPATDPRPHEALGQRTPAALYRPAPRRMPAQLAEPAYPGHDLGRRVRNAGTFRFKSRQLFLSDTLLQERIALEETGDGLWSIYFYEVLLARLDERDFQLRG